MRIRDDYVFGTTTAALTDVATSMASDELARLGVVANPDIAAITLHNSTTGLYEIVHVTAHTAAATTATILRAQEGSTAQAWPAGTTWLHGVTATDLALKADLDSPALTGSATLDGAALVKTTDPRLVDARTPTAHTHALANVTDVTASAAEVNILDGAIVTVTEINFLDGVTSSIQTQLNGKAASSHSHAIGDLPTDATVPAALGTAAAGTAATVSRRDHVHAMPTAAQVGASATGHTHVKASITDFAHTHLIADLPTDATVPAALGTAAAGTAATIARRDHVHQMPTAAQVGAAATAHTHAQADINGLGTSLAGKSDTTHGHALTDANITGIIPDAQLPARLKAYHSNDVPGGNWNLATETGYYASDTALNSPGGGWWQAHVEAHNSAWCTQTLHQFTGDTVNDTVTYRRDQNNGAWSAWYRIRQSEAELDARYTNKDSTATAANRVMNALTGGGNITLDGSYNLLWTSRFITMGGGRGTHWSTVGYYDINMPPAGTVIPGYGGHGGVTVTAAGIPLTSWAQLYYEPPIGGSQASDPARFRILLYTGNFVIPDHWVFIAIRGEGNQVRLGTGHLMNAATTATATDPYPMYAVDGHTHTAAQASLGNVHNARQAYANYGGNEIAAAASGTSGTVTLNCATASVFTLTPTGNVTTLSITNPPASGSTATITLIVNQGATAYSIATPTGGVFYGAASPTQAANKDCIFTYLTTDGGASWHCSAAVQA